MFHINDDYSKLLFSKLNLRARRLCLYISPQGSVLNEMDFTFWFNSMDYYKMRANEEVLDECEKNRKVMLIGFDSFVFVRTYFR